METNNNLIKPAFTPNLLEEDRTQETISIKLNPQRKELLKEAKALLRQPKDSTVIWQLATIGYKSITNQETKEILNIIFENDRKNKRLGIAESEFK